MKILSNELTNAVSGGSDEEMQYYGRYIFEKLEDRKARMVMYLVVEGDIQEPKA